MLNFVGLYAILRYRGAYHERPLNICERLYGTNSPFNVILLEWKLGVILTEALFPPFKRVILTEAEIPIPDTCIEK